MSIFLWLLPGFAILALLVSVVDKTAGGSRRRRPRPVPRPGTTGYRRDSDTDMLLYLASDSHSMINGQMPDVPQCDDPPTAGDAGADQGDCDSGGWDSGGGDSGGGDSGGGDSGGGGSSD